MKAMPAKFIIHCAWCGKEKACTRSYRKFCTTDCSRASGRAKLEVLRAQGKDPAQTPAVRKLRIALAKQRAASGELLGRALVKERRRVVALRDRGQLTGLPNAPDIAAAEGRPAVVEPKGDTPGYIQFELRGDEYAYTEQRWSSSLKESTLITLDGHGCSVRVERGELILKPGASYSAKRPDIKLVRGLHSTSAIVIFGASGAVTLQAMEWCAAQKLALFAINRDGELTTIVSLPAHHNGALHRLQHRASSLKLAREIVKAKIEASIKARPQATEKLEQFLQQVPKATSISHVRMLEANAAIWYWRAWHFSLKTAGRHFPDHWRDFDQRGSTLTVGNKKAVHPINAILNYGYAILAAQIQRELEVRGFDVSLGTLHADLEGRPSLGAGRK